MCMAIPDPIEESAVTRSAFFAPSTPKTPLAPQSNCAVTTDPCCCCGPDTTGSFLWNMRSAEPRILANARIVEIDDAYTFVPADQPEVVAREISQFLSSTEYSAREIGWLRFAPSGGCPPRRPFAH